MGALPDVAVHVVDTADKTLGNTSTISGGFKAVAGLQAFRQYNWITDIRALNTSGNFRGMVVSARWATTYNVVSKVGDKLGTIATVASIAHNVLTMAPQFEAVYNSNDDEVTKGLRFVSLAGTVSQKTLAGVITGPVHLTAAALTLGCKGIAWAGQGNRVTQNANSISQTIKRLDADVDYGSDYVTDNDRQLRVIQRVMNIVIQ